MENPTYVEPWAEYNSFEGNKNSTRICEVHKQIVMDYGHASNLPHITSEMTSLLSIVSL